MNSRLNALLQKAALAPPPEKPGRSTWAPYMPIIRVLMDQRSHDLSNAIKWLVDEGEIKPRDAGNARRAIAGIIRRKNKSNKA